MLPFTSPCWLRKASSARLMTSTMALPMPSTSKAADVMNAPRSISQGKQMHAGFGLFQQGHDAGDCEWYIAAQALDVEAERTQAHFADDELCAELDASLQQGLEVADAALPVQRIARPVVECGRRPHQGADARHGEEQHGGFVDGERRTGKRQRIVGALVVAGAQDDRDTALGRHDLLHVGQPGRFRIAISSKAPASASYINRRPESERPMSRISFTTSVACSAPSVPARAPSTPACAQLGTASSDGAWGNRQRRQGWGSPCQAL